jgi:DNA-binding NtrC family response regulator
MIATSCATTSGTPAKARSARSAMDTTPELGLLAAGNAAAPHVPAGRAPSPQAVGVRSLREFVERAVVEAEAQAIRRALATAKGNKSLAARLLQTNYTTLHAKMKRFKISAGEFFPG